MAENPHISKNIKLKKRQQLSFEEYVKGILSGDRTILSRAITLVESSKPEHQELAQQIIEQCIPHSGKSLRIGITGVPGVGKSTFIEFFGKQLTAKGKKLAVLAIDPSSQKSGGSILGDKTRMEELSIDPNAYVRPTPSSGSLGGVAENTRETILLCEAAGFDTIIVETVGVGQSEIAVHSMVDFFLLLMLAGAGDELQGIKRGIMEMADTIAITKTDGDNVKNSNRARAEYASALHLFPPTDNGWVPRVETCSTLTGNGLEKLWKIMDEFQRHTVSNGAFDTKRKKQAKYWMHETIKSNLLTNFYTTESIKAKLSELEQLVIEGKMSPFLAAKKLIEKH